MEYPIQRIIIPEYIQKIKTAEARRPKYYRSLSDLPKNWNRENYYKKGNKVYRKRDDSVCIKNPSVANKPRYQQIAGNAFWSTNIHWSVRNDMQELVKEDLKDHCEHIRPFEEDEYPLRVHWEAHHPRLKGGRDWDLSNIWGFYKMYEDGLRNFGILEEDNTQFVSWINGPKFIPVDKPEDRMMILSFYHDDREVLV